jgi:hypothetical protein
VSFATIPLLYRKGHKVFPKAETLKKALHLLLENRTFAGNRNIESLLQYLDSLLQLSECLLQLSKNLL